MDKLCTLAYMYVSKGPSCVKVEPKKLPRRSQLVIDSADPEYPTPSPHDDVDHNKIPIRISTSHLKANLPFIFYTRVCMCASGTECLPFHSWESGDLNVVLRFYIQM